MKTIIFLSIGRTYVQFSKVNEAILELNKSIAGEVEVKKRYSSWSMKKNRNRLVRMTLIQEEVYNRMLNIL